MTRESQHNTVNFSVNTSCVESCTKTNFSEVVHPLNFSKNNFPLLKARPNSYLFTDDLVFSLKAKVFFFPPISPIMSAIIEMRASLCPRSMPRGNYVPFGLSVIVTTNAEGSSPFLKRYLGYV